MPYTVSVDHASHTVLVKGTGEGSTADTLRLIAGLEETLRACAGYDFIYDSVEMQIASSPADMLRVAEALFEHGRAVFKRMALVVPRSRVHLARMFTALAHPFGVRADVFTHIDDARRWLGLEEE